MSAAAIRAGLAELADPERAAGMAAYFQARPGGYGEGATLRLADRLLTDPADLVQRAVGWMLREVANRDPARAEEFLGPRHRRMPRTMLRYAVERFPADRRRDYLAGRI